MLSSKIPVPASYEPEDASNPTIGDLPTLTSKVFAVTLVTFNHLSLTGSEARG